MRLTVNKKEAKILENIHILEDKSKISIALKKENISTVNIDIHADYETDINYQMKNVLIMYDSKGEIMIGIRNRYGNGVKVISLKTLEYQLWKENPENRIKTIGDTFKAGFES